MCARGGVALFVLALASCALDPEPPLSSTSSALGRPPIAASLDGWTIRAQLEPGAEPGTLRATVTFDDHGQGGLRSGGVCLVADLELGPCEQAQDCVDAAIARGLPGNGGAAGWFHYCVAAGDDGGPRHRERRCWTRPDTQANLCQLGPGGRPGDIRGVEKSADRPGLAPATRAWTALACLAGGTAADGSTVGDPLGCARQSRHVYAVDDALVAPAPPGR